MKMLYDQGEIKIAIDVDVLNGNKVIRLDDFRIDPPKTFILLDSKSQDARDFCL